MATNLKLKARIVEVFGSQSEFADKLRLQESVVSRVIRGYKHLTVEEQNRWAKSLATTAPKLF